MSWHFVRFPETQADPTEISRCKVAEMTLKGQNQAERTSASLWTLTSRKEGLHTHTHIWAMARAGDNSSSQPFAHRFIVYNLIILAWHLIHTHIFLRQLKIFTLSSMSFGSFSCFSLRVLSVLLSPRPNLILFIKHILHKIHFICSLFRKKIIRFQRTPPFCRVTHLIVFPPGRNCVSEEG